MSFNTSNFKIGACTISYKGTVLGGTQSGPSFNIEPEYYESKCDQAGGRVVRKVITNMKITVTAELKEIDSGFAQILDGNGKITTALVGSDLLGNGGALILTPVDASDTVGYSFPNAVISPKTEYAFKAEEDHVLKIEFEVFPDAGGVFMEKIAVGA
jgi:hypothetical protein